MAVKTRPAGRRRPHIPVEVRRRLAGGQVGYRSVDRLVDAVGRGDRAAFGVLYRALSPRLLPGLRTCLGDSMLASRVLTGTFIEVWRVARHRIAAGGADAWITAVAEHRAVELLRLLCAGPVPVGQAAIDDACAQLQHAELVALLASAPGRRRRRHTRVRAR